MGLASIVFFLSASAAETKVHQGRIAPLYGDPTVALESFQSAAELEPDYLYFSVFPQGIWTYVRRAAYAAGRYAEARFGTGGLSPPRRQHGEALLGPYLNAERRSSKRPEGNRERHEGLHEWLDYVNQYAASSYGQYWDPANEIRSEIKNSLAMISGKEIDGQKLMVSGEWVGRQIEEEIDIARGREREIDLDATRAAAISKGQCH